MVWGAIAVGGASAAASLISGSKARKAMREAQDKALAFQQAQIDAAVAELEKVGVPPLEAQKIVVQYPELVGLEEVEELGPSRFEEYEVAPELAGAQREALEALAEVGEAGLTPAERAERRAMIREIGAQQQAQQQAILQQAQARGMGGSGAELIAQLQASQAGAERMQRAGEAQQQAAERRALEAIGARAGLAGQVRGQEFQEFGAKASAADRIAEFNRRQRAEAQLRNLQRRQAAEEARIAAQNLQERYNKELLQQRYQNELARAQAIAGARTGGTGGMAQMIAAGGQQRGQQYAQTGKAISEAIAGIGKTAIQAGAFGGGDKKQTR